MKERLVVGIIADTSIPVAVRLLEDLATLRELDHGLGNMIVLLLENPAGSTDPAIVAGLMEAGRRGGLAIELIGRAVQERDARRGRFGRLALESGRLSIATARTLIQRYAGERAGDCRACVWLLDEDLRLLPLIGRAQSDSACLSGEVQRLRERRVDVGVGPILGAPPLPARSSVRVNLEDVRRHLEAMTTLTPDAPWPDHRDSNARLRERFPEYYYDFSRAHGDAAVYPMWIEPAYPGETVGAVFRRLCTSVEGLQGGQPVTRDVRTEVRRGSQALSDSELRRGGNTLVLRSELLLEFPNLALRTSGRTSRRSDMIWARLVTHLGGARLARSELVVMQDRSGPGRSAFAEAKLLDDVCGSALVAALDQFLARFLEAGGAEDHRHHAHHGARAYVEHKRERVTAIQRSQGRVQGLLDELLVMLGHEGNKATWWRLPDYREAAARLESALRLLRAEYETSGTESALWAQELLRADQERTVVEAFLLDLKDEIAAYRDTARKAAARTSFA